jgi:hypothetical protein
MYEKITYYRGQQIIGYLLIYGRNTHFALLDSDGKMIENIDYKKVIKDKDDTFDSIANMYFSNQCKSYLIANGYLIENAKPILVTTKFGVNNK